MLTFGSDPEIFVCETIDNEDWCIPVPHFLENLGVPEIGFDKTRKHPIILKNDSTNVIMDGVAFEFNTKPHTNAKDFYKDIQAAIELVNEFAEKFKVHVTIKPAVKYDFMKYYDPNSKLLSWCGIFGCDPDKDAFFEEYNSPEIDVVNHLWRYGGGHLHISDDNKLIKDYPVPYTKLLAITCGNYSIASSPYPELDKQRAFKYGLPGRYRVQNYPNNVTGVEYRSPSNVWINSLESVEGMFYWAEKAYDYLSNPKKGLALINEFAETTINNMVNIDQTTSQNILNLLG